MQSGESHVQKGTREQRRGEGGGWGRPDLDDGLCFPATRSTRGSTPRGSPAVDMESWGAT